MDKNLYVDKFNEIGTEIVDTKESVKDCDDEMYELYVSMTEFQEKKSKNNEEIKRDRKSIREKRKRIFWIVRFLRILEKRINRLIDLYVNNKKIKPEELKKCVHTMSLFEEYFQYETENDECYIVLTGDLFKGILSTLRYFIITYNQEKTLLEKQISELSSNIDKKIKDNAECDQEINKCKREMKSLESRDNKAKRKMFKLKRGINGLNNKFVNDNIE